MPLSRHPEGVFGMTTSLSSSVVAGKNGWTGPFSFIQLADPQFGCHAHMSGKTEEQVARYRSHGIPVQAVPKFHGFEIESRMFRRAISEANRLGPDFVVTCGDIINRWGSEEEVREALTIAAELDDGIPMCWVAGNHDVIDYYDGGGTHPTEATLAAYRSRFGRDCYAFQHRGVSFIVLNSSLMCHLEEQLEDHWRGQLRFLETELESSRERGSVHTIVFVHYPFYLHHPDEEWSEEDWWEVGLVIPLERRRVVLDLFERYSVSAVFAGHTHKNYFDWYGTTQMVTSSAVGYPMGDDPPGYRIVRVFEDRIDHDYYGFDDGPEAIELSDRETLKLGGRRS